MSFFFFCVPFHFFFSTTIYHDNMVYDWASTDRLGLLIFWGIGYAYSGLSRCVCLAFGLIVSFFLVIRAAVSSMSSFSLVFFFYTRATAFPGCTFGLYLFFFFLLF